ncbi:tetratricopeptide repeat protein [Thermostichus vulcanus]|uniref:Tetratricopeptide repeat protein n=1 Tax=Thermostichus vulcanus str. 'Rupite' TaxID=2813851 RepID=A0ABT0C7T5_THEVL|nr:tetratricopeptide repeat protein [Thermostichus vulcanus]MCJ2541435.1 tetratricopeptide repeat protein [Thermostichus vulcanus str. 'Rupite']
MNSHLNWTQVVRNGLLCGIPVLLLACSGPGSQRVATDPSPTPIATSAAAEAAETATEVALDNRTLEQVNQLLTQGQELLEQKDLSRAYAVLTHAVNMAPNLPEPYLHRGKVNEAQQQPTQALWDYSQALQLNPRYEEALRARGYLYYNLEDYPNALEDYQTVTQINPLQAKDFRIMAEIQEKLEDPRGASDSLETYLRLTLNQPNQPAEREELLNRVIQLRMQATP